MPIKQDFRMPPQLLEMATAVAIIAKDDIDNDSDKLSMSMNPLQDQGYGSNTRLPPDKQQCIGKKKTLMVEQKMRSTLLFSAAADYGHGNEWLAVATPKKIFRGASR